VRAHRLQPTACATTPRRSVASVLTKAWDQPFSDLGSRSVQFSVGSRSVQFSVRSCSVQFFSRIPFSVRFLNLVAQQLLSISGRATATTGRAIASWPLLLSLLEQLPKSRQLLRVENRFDLLVGAIPDGAHLGRSSPSRTAACAIGRRATTTPAATASSAAPSASPSTAASALPSTALTAPVLSELFHRHCFVGDHRADFGLLRGIEL
jgi:hypothetical protein